MEVKNWYVDADQVPSELTLGFHPVNAGTSPSVGQFENVVTGI